jgi:hypothetical protein
MRDLYFAETVKAERYRLLGINPEWGFDPYGNRAWLDRANEIEDNEMQRFVAPLKERMNG